MLTWGPLHVRVLRMGSRGRNALLFLLCVVVLAGFVLFAAMLTARILLDLIQHV